MDEEIKDRYVKDFARIYRADPYLGVGEHDWEDATDDGSAERLRVPGGWIYLIDTYSHTPDWSGADQNGQVAVFVPLPVDGRF